METKNGYDGKCNAFSITNVLISPTGIKLHELYGQTEMTGIGKTSNFCIQIAKTHFYVLSGGWSPEREGSMGIPEKDPGYDIVVIAGFSVIEILTRQNIRIFSDY